MLHNTKYGRQYPTCDICLRVFKKADAHWWLHEMTAVVGDIKRPNTDTHLLLTGGLGLHAIITLTL